MTFKAIKKLLGQECEPNDLHINEMARLLSGILKTDVIVGKGKTLLHPEEINENDLDEDEIKEKTERGLLI